LGDLAAFDVPAGLFAVGALKGTTRTARTPRPLGNASWLGDRGYQRPATQATGMRFPTHTGERIPIHSMQGATDEIAQNRSTLDPQTDPRSVCFSFPEIKRLHGIIGRVVGTDKMSLVPGKVNLAVRILSDPCGRGARGRARSQRDDPSGQGFGSRA
jgi:hypothetical protein